MDRIGNPFGPKDEYDTTVVSRLHCGRRYPANEMKYERREGNHDLLWYCKYQDCDSSGLGMGIFETDSIEGQVKIPRWINIKNS